MVPVNYAGLQLRNPVIVASATPSINVEAIKRAADAGAGAVVTKSMIFPDPVTGKPAGACHRPRFRVYNNPHGFDPVVFNRDGQFSFFRNAEVYPTPDEMGRMLEELKGPHGVDIPIIVSICGRPDDYEQWRKLARMAEDMGADAIEINMHAVPKVYTFDPLFVSVPKSEVKIPVISKMMSLSDDPILAAKKAEAAGADAIAGLGTFQGPGIEGLEIDAANERPLMGSHGLGGSWLRPVGLNYVAKLAQGTSLPLSGVTGIQTGEDAIKYMLVGATTVQICGAIYAKGYKVLTEVSDGIDKWMAEHGYKTIEEFRGKALEKLDDPEWTESDPPVRAVVNQDKCIGCGVCKDSCMYSALSFENKKAHISEKCDGCGVCWSMCPSKAITMERYER